jgi:hypothetical protein
MSDQDEEFVSVGDAVNEAEASIIVGFLEAQGIEAVYEPRGELGSPFPTSATGSHEILVRESDADAARAALADVQAND